MAALEALVDVEHVVHVVAESHQFRESRAAVQTVVEILAVETGAVLVAVVGAERGLEGEPFGEPDIRVEASAETELVAAVLVAV